MGLQLGSVPAIFQGQICDALRRNSGHRNLQLRRRPAAQGEPKGTLRGRGRDVRRDEGHHPDLHGAHEGR